MKNTVYYGLLLGVIISLTSCYSNYIEVMPGQSTTYSRSQGFRTEGGGQEDTFFLAGTHFAGDYWKDITAKPYDHTPTWYLNTFSVPNTKMDKQSITGESGILIMVNPEKVANINEHFDVYKTKIHNSLTAATQLVMGNLDLGSAQADDTMHHEFDSQVDVAKRIFDETVKNFKENNSAFFDDFIFICASINHISFPPAIMKANELVVKSEYRLQQKKLENTLNTIVNRIKEKRSTMEVNAFTQEIENLDQRVLDNMTVDLITHLGENKGAHLEIWFPFDPKTGHIYMFAPGLPASEVVKK